MKREAITHTKLKRLCRRLDIPLWQAVGLLEMLWHVTARETPRGDIGKLSDEDVALALDYRGSESVMVEALVLSGWLDKDPEHRLLVHDWPDHADDGVHMKLARARQRFANGTAPKTGRLPHAERAQAEAFYSAACTQTLDPCARRTHGVREPEPEPEPLPEPPPGPEPRQSQAPPEPERRPARAALEVVDGMHPTVILTELKEIYHLAGLPIAPKHEQLAMQFLLDIPPENRHRVADYVKHCLASGRWSGASTTKSLLNLLRDGDWNVPIVERALPAAARPREPSRAEANSMRALEIFKRQRGEA